MERAACAGKTSAPPSQCLRSCRLLPGAEQRTRACGDGTKENLQLATTTLLEPEQLFWPSDILFPGKIVQETLAPWLQPHVPRQRSSEEIPRKRKSSSHNVRRRRGPSRPVHRRPSTTLKTSAPHRHTVLPMRRHVLSSPPCAASSESSPACGCWLEPSSPLPFRPKTAPSPSCCRSSPCTRCSSSPLSGE